MVLRCLRTRKGERVHSAIAIRDSLVNQLKILQLDCSAQWCNKSGRKVAAISKGRLNATNT